MACHQFCRYSVDMGRWLGYTLTRRRRTMCDIVRTCFGSAYHGSTYYGSTHYGSTHYGTTDLLISTNHGPPSAILNLNPKYLNSGWYLQMNSGRYLQMCAICFLIRTDHGAPSAILIRTHFLYGTPSVALRAPPPPSAHPRRWPFASPPPQPRSRRRRPCRRRRRSRDPCRLVRPPPPAPVVGRGQ